MIVSRHSYGKQSQGLSPSSRYFCCTGAKFGLTNTGKSEPIEAEAGIVGMFGYFFKVSLNWFTMAVMYPYDHPLSEPE